jgi:cytochrome c556
MFGRGCTRLRKSKFGKSKLNASRYRRALVRAGVAAALSAVSLAAPAQEGTAPMQDAIFARKTLKDAVCDRMMNIERMIGTGQIDIDVVHTQADAISALLLAFPHLFPPASNRWKPNAEGAPETLTLASPDLWTNFPDFYRQAVGAARSAFELSRADKADDAKARARELRIACDTCHALYLEDQ